MDTPILRVARPSDNLGALLDFYAKGLGMDVLFRFEDHAGFDGIILGRPGMPYHLSSRKSGAMRRDALPAATICWYSICPIARSGQP